jgi:hypothetical protein
MSRQYERPLSMRLSLNLGRPKKVHGHKGAEVGVIDGFGRPGVLGLKGMGYLFADKEEMVLVCGVKLWRLSRWRKDILPLDSQIKWL